MFEGWASQETGEKKRCVLLQGDVMPDPGGFWMEDPHSFPLKFHPSKLQRQVPHLLVMWQHPGSVPARIL